MGKKKKNTGSSDDLARVSQKIKGGVQQSLEATALALFRKRVAGDMGMLENA